MRFIGHTMGTPGISVAESVAVFADIGFDGMELICQEGTVFSTDADDATARLAARTAADAGVPIVTLTPYAWDINGLDPAKAGADSAKLARAIELAALMGASHVRAYSGRAPAEGDGQADAVSRAVSALREAGRRARDNGVVVVVENHPGTVTRSGAATRELLERVGLPSVRALYDPANVLYDTDEPWETTLRAQSDAIAYVHVKDFYMDGDRRHACDVGEGIVPWGGILPALRRSGYDGCLSCEYERKWYPEDLPRPKEGMRKSVAFLKQVLAP